MPSPLSRLQAHLPAWLRRQPGLALVPAVVLVALLADEAVHDGPVICIFRLTFGLPCAGCGLTRGFVALGNGDLAAAVGHNLLTPLILAWMLTWWLQAVAAALRGRVAPPQPRWLVAVAIAVLSAYWFARDVAFLLEPEPLRRMAEDSLILKALALLRR